MKKALIIFLIGAMLMSFASCGTDTQEPESTTEAAPAESLYYESAVGSILSSGIYTIRMAFKTSESEGFTVATTAAAAEQSQSTTLAQAIPVGDYSGVVTKTVNIAGTAYKLDIEEISYSVTLVRQNDVYTITDGAKYETLDAAKYSPIAKVFEDCFSFNLESLTFVTLTDREYNGKIYTREEYTAPDGSITALWFETGVLKYIEEQIDNSMQSKLRAVSLKAGADGNAFEIGAETVQAKPGEMDSYTSSISTYLAAFASTDTMLEMATAVSVNPSYDCSISGHMWKSATCLRPKTCSACGITEGGNGSHTWKAATCTSAKKCKTCGTTTGSALGHNYSSATCTLPATCSRCGGTKGEALGHKWTEAVTCGAIKTCTVCGETSGAAIKHNYAAANCTEPEKCRNCGAVKEGSKPLGHEYVNGVCVRCEPQATATTTTTTKPQDTTTTTTTTKPTETSTTSTKPSVTTSTTTTTKKIEVQEPITG